MKAASLPLIIAHRGESRDAPENTLAAIGLAWARGADAVEIDVRQSCDGEVLVIHDADLRRVGRARLSVAHATAAALREVDVGGWKHRRWAGERVPTFEEVLATVPRGKRLFVEIKDGPAIVPALAGVVAKSPVSPRQLVVMSFRRDTLARAAQVLSRYEVCLLLTARQWKARNGVSAAIKAAGSLGCSSLDVEAHRDLGADFADAVHRAEFRLYVWTVNRLASASRLARIGVDGITTDRAAWLKERLKG